MSRRQSNTEYEKSHAHGHESEKVDQGLDAGLLLIRARDEACEACDDDAHFDPADKQRDGVRPEERDVLCLYFWDRRLVSTHWRPSEPEFNWCGFESRAECEQNRQIFFHSGRVDVGAGMADRRWEGGQPQHVAVKKGQSEEGNSYSPGDRRARL